MLSNRAFCDKKKNNFMFKKLKKTGFHHVAQAILELTMYSMIPLNLWSACPRLFRAEIIGPCHHTLPRKHFYVPSTWELLATSGFMCLKCTRMTEEVNSCFKCAQRLPHWIAKLYLSSLSLSLAQKTKEQNCSNFPICPFKRPVPGMRVSQI